MVKQTLNKVKKILAVSLAVLFVVSLTAASASACRADHSAGHCSSCDHSSSCKKRQI